MAVVVVVVAAAAAGGGRGGGGAARTLTFIVPDVHDLLVAAARGPVVSFAAHVVLIELHCGHCCFACLVVHLAWVPRVVALLDVLVLPACTVDQAHLAVVLLKQRHSQGEVLHLLAVDALLEPDVGVVASVCKPLAVRPVLRVARKHPSVNR